MEHRPSRDGRAGGLGAALLRREDGRLLTGRGLYTEDIPAAGMLFGAVARSPHAHARIVGIDAAEARRQPGVEAVLTAADLDDLGIGPLPCQIRHERRPGLPLVVPYRGALARDKVVHVGDPVAFVVARSSLAARDAAEAVRVKYDPLPAVAEPTAALSCAASAIWPGAPDNVSFVFSVGREAETEAALASADRVVRLDMRIPRVAAMPLETRGGLGLYDPATGRFTLWCGHQKPSLLRDELAGILGVAATDVVVRVPDVGGGFGLKGSTFPEFVLVLVAARLTGRPVRWIATRSESFETDDHAREMAATVDLGLDRDGRFLALRYRSVANLGGYLSSFGPHSSTNNLGGLSGVYRIPAIHAAVTGVFTNTAPTGPYRGAGRPEATYALERTIDVAAAELGVDPVELRRRNLIGPEEMPYRTGFVFTYDTGAFARGMDRALALADRDGFEARRAAARSRGRLRGIGVANAIEQAGAFMPESAEIAIAADGAVTLLSGTVSNGQGHETAFEQLLTELLGPLPGPFRLVQGDTARIPEGVGTFGSRSLSVGGAAAGMAAAAILGKARAIAAHLLEVDAADLVPDPAAGGFTIVGTDRRIGLAEIARAAHDAAALPDGVEPGLSASALFVPPAPTFPNGTHVCEVEVDPETGRVELVSYVVVDDAGTVVNPILLAGQIHGGLAQGIGEVLSEAIAYDRDSGQLLTGSFMDYGMPRADELVSFVHADNGVPSTTNPLGIKGAGEAGTVGALACVSNAILDALSVAGIRHMDMPFTPARVWEALARARAR